MGEIHPPEGVDTTAARAERFRLADVGLLGALLLFAALSVLPAIRHPQPVMEDAAMLLRYSQNLADGHGISWNVGEHPVEGATDFLYMVAIAGVARVLHLDTVTACRTLLACCSLLLPLAVFACCRWTIEANRWVAVAAALYVASSPSGAYVIEGFGAPFMMLAVALAWWAGIQIVVDRGPVGWRPALLFSLLALTVGLTRPEGNVLAVLMLLAIVFLRGAGETNRLMVAFGAVFLLLGGSYFLWRLHYYGYLLPNPFYVKGGGQLHLQGLGMGTENAVKITWPFVPLALTALRNRHRTHLLMGLLIPMIGYTSIWILLSNENNHLMRFQMPLLPVAAMFIPLLLQNIFAELDLSVERLSDRARFGLQAAAAIAVLAVCYVMYRSVWSPIPGSSGEQFSRELGKYANRGYTMAVTEAGTFPYYSRWKAIDALGLNDATIAHHGLNEAYLDRYQPELILYHMYNFTPRSGWVNADQTSIARRDGHAITVLHAYAVHHHYILAAAYGGEPCSVHFFYVRPDTKDTAAIVDFIRNTPYRFLDTGILSVDFRNGVRPECGFPELGE